MTEHERMRMEAWLHAYAHSRGTESGRDYAKLVAEEALQDFDQRFPRRVHIDNGPSVKFSVIGDVVGGPRE